MNRLFYGDNLAVLREHVASESVDLIYLDPPFNSNANYNILFKSPKGASADTQIEAFEDTWHWNDTAEDAFDQVARSGNTKAFDLLNAMRGFLGDNDMMAYLAMMAVRLIELHRVLKPTGSLYLHCDPTASHYLKLLLDGVFGHDNFRNEIIWKRTSSHNRAKRWGPVHDTLLFYSAGANFTWNRVLQDLDQPYIDDFYKHQDHKGRYRISDITGPGTRKGDSGEPWRGVNPTDRGRHWEPAPDRALPSWFRFPDGYGQLSVRDRLDVLDKQGLIYWPKKLGGMPGFRRY